MSAVSYGLGGNCVDLGRGLMHVWRWTGSKLFWIGSAGMTKLFFIGFFQNILNKTAIKCVRLLMRSTDIFGMTTK